jgi:sulfite reductase (NADPH) flavoprotein alpha-component
VTAFAPSPPFIPENAPFSSAQRAWLNGFLAGLYGGARTASEAGMSRAEPKAEIEDFPWHDPALELDERLALAAGKPLPRRLMAAMAQLDCGQCGYLCQTYSEALAEGRETSVSLCVPGAKATSKALKRLLAEAPPPVVAAPPPKSVAPTSPVCEVRVLAAERLTGPDSAKDVRHVVIDLGQSGLSYLPGDSILLACPNDPSLVQACLAALGVSKEVMVEGTATSVGDLFSRHVDIARPLDRTFDLLAMSATNKREAAILRRLSEGEDGVAPDDADLLDLLEAFPSARPPLADLVRSLPALRPRLYSIASSLRATPGHVHLCVSVVRTERRGRLRRGVASAFLAERAQAHGPIAAAITSSHFRLPADPTTPVIMVGPGTGIAPFRAFLQERAAAGVKGRTWLFFGDQHEASDFLFRDELMAWQADGTLTRLDTAFSRDQARKVYVQDRLQAASADVWRWLQDGGYFYVCGDATRMARDVDAALRKVAQLAGGLDGSQARDWIVALARQGRYLRDVY